ncbi:hypothetical protein OF83DRAFT_15082 [Amylostereum chailletii]|nr:hypothetical protein OF83DRAFT_15082 [Amylostereum chailletii]
MPSSFSIHRSYDVTAHPTHLMYSTTYDAGRPDSQGLRPMGPMRVSLQRCSATRLPPWRICLHASRCRTVR